MIAAALIDPGSGFWVTAGAFIVGVVALVVVGALFDLMLTVNDRWESEVDRRNRERRAVARALQPEKGER